MHQYLKLAGLTAGLTILALTSHDTVVAQTRLTNARVSRDMGSGAQCQLENQPHFRREQIVLEGRRVERQITTQSATCEMRERFDGFPQARLVLSGGFVYEKIGRSAWRYDDFEESQRYLTGMPPVDRAVMGALIESTLETQPATIFSHNALHNIASVSGVEVTDDPDFWPGETNRVRLRYRTTFEYVDRRTVETSPMTVECGFRRESADSEWAVDMCTQDYAHGREVLSSRELAQGERLENMLEQADRRALAAQRASMPQVEVPTFTTEYELVDFVFRVLHEEPRDRARAFLYRMFTSNNYLDDGETLNAQALQVLTAALDEAYGPDGGFRGQYCRLPLPKDNVSWWGRGNGTQSRIAGREANGSWRLSILQIGLLHGRGLGRLGDASLCEQTFPGGFRLGDHVRVNYYGSEREGFVVGESGQYVRVMFGRSQNDVESMSVDTVRRFAN